MSVVMESVFTEKNRSLPIGVERFIGEQIHLEERGELTSNVDSREITRSRRMSISCCAELSSPESWLRSAISLVVVRLDSSVASASRIQHEATEKKENKKANINP